MSALSISQDDPMDSIVSSYSGIGLIQRLIHLASISSDKQYQIRVYERIIQLIKEETKLIDWLEGFRLKLYKLNPSNPWAKVDTQWVSRTEEEIEKVSNQHDLSLSSFGNSENYQEVISVSIELAKFNTISGDFHNAQRFYRRALDVSLERDEDMSEDITISTSDQSSLTSSQGASDRSSLTSSQIEVKIAEVSILGKQWSYAKNVAMKVLQYDTHGKRKRSAKINADNDSIICLGVIYALSCLGNSDYEEAAASFLKVGDGIRNGSSGHVGPGVQGGTQGGEQVGVQAGSSSITISSMDLERALESGELLRLKDIGMITTICALATFSRQHIRFMLDRDSLFSAFIEETPYIRTLISSFLAVKYKDFFALWKAHSLAFRADLYLGPHYDKLYSLIKERAFSQYLNVYKSLPLETMQTVFADNEDSFIDDLSSFIGKSKSNMRIDELNGAVSIASQNEYSGIYEQSESLATDLVHDSYSLMWAVHSMDLPEALHDGVK